MRVAFELSGQDCADLRTEIALLEDYLGNLGEPETTALRWKRETNERRLDLMRRLIAAVPPSPKVHQPGEPLHDIEVATARSWIKALRGSMDIDTRDREKLAGVLERLIDAAPRQGLDHIALARPPLSAPHRDALQTLLADELGRLANAKHTQLRHHHEQRIAALQAALGEEQSK